MGDLGLNRRTVATAVVISLIAAATAIFGYLETMAHIRYTTDNQHPGFHAINQFREHQLRLETALAHYAFDDGEVDHDTLMERFDILWSRVDVLISKETIGLVGDDVKVPQLIESLRETLRVIDPEIQELEPGDREGADHIVAELQELFGPYEILRRSYQENADIRRLSLVSEARGLGYIQMALLLITFAAGGALCVVVFRQARRAQFLALHDPLTGLPNRAQLDPALRRAERDAQAKKLLVAVHCIDLDRFKSINDTLGHPVGDELLIAVGKRLVENVRAADSVIRLGGDEFAIVQRGLTSDADAKKMAIRLVEAGTQPFHIAGHDLVSGLSVGSAVFPRDAGEISSLVEKADLALYEAKRLGRQTYCFFDYTLEEHAIRQRSLESELRRALANGGLEVHFQPQFTLPDRRLMGAEALIRWQHPEEGLISPKEFIPIAEECGLIGDIGRLVLDRACAEASRWLEAGISDLHMAVNLSPAQFEREDVTMLVASTLGRFSLPPDRLELEITENLLLKDKEEIRSALIELRGLGVSIALDDFGAGYSSLSYLNKFTFDKIKIDGSFVQSLDSPADRSPFIEAIVHIAGGLGMVVIAEGVETRAQLEALAEMGCHQAQGFELGRPEPAERFRERIALAMREERQPSWRSRIALGQLPR
jgi:diguanylate cyclase (GGDEF)-like protein